MGSNKNLDLKINYSDWISVADKLPYSDVSVLVYDFSRGIQIAYIDCETSEWVLPEYCSAPLFWMPLPDKPKFDVEQLIASE